MTMTPFIICQNIAELEKLRPFLEKCLSLKLCKTGDGDTYVFNLAKFGRVGGDSLKLYIATHIHYGMTCNVWMEKFSYHKAEAVLNENGDYFPIQVVKIGLKRRVLGIIENFDRHNKIPQSVRQMLK